MKIKDMILNITKEQKIFLILSLVIIVQAIWFVSSQDSYAYYSSSNEIPILSTKIGNFSGKGDTSALESNSDVNLLYYIQDMYNSKKYNVSNRPPINIEYYKLDEKRSNCIPKSSETLGNQVSYSDYVIDNATGKVKVTISEVKPHQIVCRIYYSFDLESYTQLNGDINIIPFVESSEGTIVTIKDNKTYTFNKIPTSGYTMSGFECTSKDAKEKTEVTYENNKLKVIYSAPDLCYVYFDKEEWNK